MKPWLPPALALACAALSGCQPAPATAGDAPPAPAPVAARGQTAATLTGEINGAVLVLGAGAAEPRLVTTAALGGLEVFTLAGERLGTAAGGEVADVDVAYGFPTADGPATLLAAIDTTDNRLRLYTMQGDALVEASARELPLGFAAEGVCLFRNRVDGAFYAFIVGDGGEIDQQLLYATGDGIDARPVRRQQVPSPLKQCVADDDGALYASEEEVAVWRFNADPEAEVGARIVDAPGLGRFEEEVSGVALYDGGEGSRWLLASDAGGGRINVFDRDDGEAWLGSFEVRALGGADPVAEPGLLHASSFALGEAYPHGTLLVADEDGANAKLLSMDDVAAAIGRAPGTPRDPRPLPKAEVPAVAALHETLPVPSFGDAADDPAIWAHPTTPSKSLLVGTDKKGGLALYDLQGTQIQYLPDGKMNNVDLRDGFLLGGQPVTLVTASDRTRKAVAIYRLDGDARRLVPVADGVQPTGLEDPYGQCMYRSAKTGKTYVFINSGDGPLYQWELLDAGGGKVRADLVRKLMFETQTEGCVADDAAGLLFINEEDVALWKLDAEPDGGEAMTAVDRVADNPAIKDDLEGIGLYDLGGGRGYLVLSSQGNDTYAVYDRQAPHAYLGSFAVVANGPAGIDGISETDGLDVSSANLGPGLEYGAMVAQDGRNVLPVENQNYKIVPWQAIADALGLEKRGD